MRFRLRLAAVFVAFAGALFGRVTGIEIKSRQDVLGGRSFGAAGPYERIIGVVHFSHSTTNHHNGRIVDLDKAVNAKAGAVEFAADVIIIRPKSPDKGNGSMLFENPNRGQAHILALVDGGDALIEKDAGDGWLLRNGFTIAAIGWQWDAPGSDALHLYAPIAKDRGQTITGLVRGDLMPSKAMDEIPLGHLITGHIGGVEYPVSAPDDPRNVLTWRESRESDRHLIPRSDWQFAHLAGC
jgi:hypothetical protein